MLVAGCPEWQRAASIGSRSLRTGGDFTTFAIQNVGRHDGDLKQKGTFPSVSECSRTFSAVIPDELFSPVNPIRGRCDNPPLLCTSAGLYGPCRYSADSSAPISQMPSLGLPAISAPSFTDGLFRRFCPLFLAAESVVEGTKTLPATFTKLTVVFFLL